MIVNILSKSQFKSLISEGISDDVMYISILDPDNINSILPDNSNYKTFWFYDFEEKIGNYKIFNDDIAKEIIDFILSNKDKSKCVIHCTMGISRSGAVGEFINSILGSESDEIFQKRNPNIFPNILVLTILNKQYELCYN